MRQCGTTYGLLIPKFNSFCWGQLHWIIYKTYNDYLLLLFLFRGQEYYKYRHVIFMPTGKKKLKIKSL